MGSKGKIANSLQPNLKTMMMLAMIGRKRTLGLFVLLLLLCSSPSLAQEDLVAEKDGVELLGVEGANGTGEAGVVGDRVDLIEVQRQQLEEQNKVVITVASQELIEEKMLQALENFEQDVALGLVSPKVLPEAIVTNNTDGDGNTALIYQPPLESLFTM